MVFYRKYRPQNISELDSKSVRDTLTSVLGKADSSHAFLFTGPKGLGKTSTARIVAKVLNCEKKGKKDIEPCNECSQCKSITSGTNMDVLEIDAASNRGIDEIRDLREKIRLAPLSANKKVYIIDEVHMLTTEAFNALLKTLEEPPGHVVFVLCTTEVHKVPPTILSRCFHLQFALATAEEMVRSFKRIVKNEKITIEEDALSYIARLSEGSFRDGAKILEEVSLLAKDKKITKALIEDMYKTAQVDTSIDNLLDYLSNKQTREALDLVEEIRTKGVDFKFFLEQVIARIHIALLENIEGSKNTKFSLEDIKTLIQLLTKAHGDLKYAVVPQLPLELAIIEWTEGAEVRIEKKERSNSSPRQEQEKDILQELLSHLKQSNPITVGLLRGCRVKDYNNNTLVLETKYTYHKEKLEERKIIAVLKKAAEEISGREIVVEIVLEQ